MLTQVYCQGHAEMTTFRCRLTRIVIAVLSIMSIATFSAQSDELQRGMELYSVHCASCHGANLEGQPDWQSPNPDGTLPAPPHDESGHTWHHGDKLLFDYVKLGGAQTMASRGVGSFKSAMPSFEGVLSDQEIQEIFVFLKSHWSARARIYQQHISDAE